jgi:ubiquitin conjugation factor E4 B
MMLANEDVKMIQYTSEEITAPFLLPEMVRSFFSYLVAFGTGREYGGVD